MSMCLVDGGTEGMVFQVDNIYTCTQNKELAWCVWKMVSYLGWQKKIGGETVEEIGMKI